MTITPVASCFLKSCDTSRWKLLKLGTTVSIKPGDICSLVSDKCWFKIMPVPSIMEINKENAVKRKAEGDINCDIPDKMHCSNLGEGDNAQSSNNVPNDTLTNNNIITVKNEEICTIKEDFSNSEAVTSTDQNAENTDASSSNNNNKMQASNTTRQNKTRTSEQANEQNVPANITSTKRREKCKYGEKCYRRNAQHKAEYSHPVDPDYNLPDNRKECLYGIKCYRLNPQHREEYKHTPKPINVANNGGNRSRRRIEQSLLNTLSDVEDFSADDSEEESVDESEYEPFSETDYSDYNEYFDNTDSDWDID